MLKSDEVQFTIIPVFSNQHLNGEMDKISPPSEEARYLRSMVFINCGGTFDLTQNSIYAERTEVKMYVIDSHRPFHHKNVNDQSNRILIVAD